MVIDGQEEHGWFVQDFDLAELRRLRARERWPVKRRASARYDGQAGVLTLEELFDLRESESERAGRELGLHIELKHPEVFAELGMPLHEPLVDLLRERRLTSSLSPTSVMSFDSEVLRQLRHTVDTELVQLVDRGENVKRRRMQKIATYADAVGLHKDLAVERSIAKAGGAGLDVLVWTLRVRRAPPLSGSSTWGSTASSPTSPNRPSRSATVGSHEPRSPFRPAGSRRRRCAAGPGCGSAVGTPASASRRSWRRSHAG